MRARKRAACLLLALLMAASLAPPRTDAAGSVCFTAVNDTLLPLSDETMPFWSGSTLYVASAVFDGTDLGLYYSRSRDRTTAVLYRQRSVLTFDLTAGTIETNDGQSFPGSAAVRGDTVFLPLEVVCRYFGLGYSYMRISYGHLVRVKSDTVVLSDAAFVDAAGAPMSQRYARYERAQANETVQPEPSSDNERTPEPAQRTAYFIVESTEPADTARILSLLPSGRAVCLFAPDSLSGSDELLRRLAAGGGAVALRVDASEGAERALAQIEAGNRAVWAAANLKTRIVRLDGASEETRRLVAEAGYCPLLFTLDLSAGNVSVSNMSARILSAADSHGGSCRVFLGTDTAASATLPPLLTRLRAENCTPARLNETTLFQR